MAYGESNGHVTDDATWPWKVEVVTPIRLGPNISKTAGDASNNRYNYWIVCCEAIYGRLYILATVGVLFSIVSMREIVCHFAYWLRWFYIIFYV